MPHSDAANRDDRRWTVQELSLAATDLLTKKGVSTSPRLDCDLLLAEALGCQRIELYTRFDMPVDPEKRGRFRELIRRRLSSEPIAYILGRREFLDWTFKVSPAVLIPRPETELTVDAITTYFRHREVETLRICEVGVGSGCLVISLLLRFPQAEAIALDISPEAIEVARENAATLGVSDRLTLQLSDVFAELDTEQFDLIVSNPPYIRHDEKPELMADVKDFEPDLALYSPSDGLLYHRKVLEDGLARLNDEGLVALELPGEGGDEMLEFSSQFELDSKAYRDLAGLDRCFLAARATIPAEIQRHFL